MSTTSSVNLSDTFTETDWLECQRLAQYSVSKLRARFRLTTEEVEDLVSEGVIAAIAALRTWIPDKGSKSTWLLRRVNGEIMDQVKRLRYAGLTGDLKGVCIVNASGLMSEDSTDDDNDYQSGNPLVSWESILGTTEDTLDSNQEALAIAIAVERLPTEDRRLIEEFYGLSGVTATKSLKALGAARGVSWQAVQQRINRILSALSN